MKKQLLILLTLFFICCNFLNVFSQTDQAADSPFYKLIADVSYKDGPTEYEKERCKLDLYLPENKKNIPVVVWFHGGGLKLGDKSEDHATIIAKAIVEKEIAVALVNYRLNPEVKFPSYIDDAAAAVKWVFSNIRNYGGDTSSIFIGGHSAGAFLTYMLGLDEKYLNKYDIKTNRIAGLIPVSSQVYCHSTIREELAIKEEKVINETCPLYYISKSTPPIICLLAEEDVIIEGNQLLIKKLKEAGNKNCEIKIIPNRNHMSTIMEMQNPDDPALHKVVQFITDKINNQ